MFRSVLNPKTPQVASLFDTMKTVFLFVNMSQCNGFQHHVYNVLVVMVVKITMSWKKFIFSQIDDSPDVMLRTLTLRMVNYTCQEILNQLLSSSFPIVNPPFKYFRKHLTNYNDNEIKSLFEFLPNQTITNEYYDVIFKITSQYNVEQFVESNFQQQRNNITNQTHGKRDVILKYDIFIARQMMQAAINEIISNNRLEDTINLFSTSVYQSPGYEELQNWLPYTDEFDGLHYLLCLGIYVMLDFNFS